MKNKIIPIILIFIMSLSSSVFAYTPREYTYDELISEYGLPSEYDNSKFTNGKHIIGLYNTYNDEPYYYIYYSVNDWETFWSDDTGIGMYFLRGKGGYYEKHYIYLNDDNPTWKFESFSDNSASNRIGITNNNTFMQNHTNHEIFYSSSDILVASNTNDASDVGNVFFPASGEEIVQKHNKKTYYTQSDGKYISGDILLYDDFIKIKDFETNYSGNLYISVLKYPITKSNDYTIDEANYQYEIISIIDKNSSSQNWQFSNPFNYNVLNEEECIYAIGIGPVDVPFILTSEWFNINLNEREYMNSENFRAKYYVEDLTNLFIEDNGNQGGSTGSGDSGEVIPPVQDEELEIENGFYPSLMTLYLNGLVPKDTTKPEYISENYLGKHYYKVDFEVLLDTQAIYNLNRLKIILGIYKANIDKENRKITYSQIGTKYADAMAVYESAKEHFGNEVYAYDLFNIWNRDGKIDTYINEYGIDNIAFSLHLFDTKIGYMDTYKDYLAFNKEWTIEVSGDNTIIGNDKVETDTDISINADSSFWNLLEETKKFIDKFLSFFDIFPGWLISLISTAVIVAIICRIIGR